MISLLFLGFVAVMVALSTRGQAGKQLTLVHVGEHPDHLLAVAVHLVRLGLVADQQGAGWEAQHASRVLRVKVRRRQVKAVVRRELMRGCGHGDPVITIQAHVHHKGSICVHDDADVWKSDDRPDVLGHLYRIPGQRLV